MNPMLASKDTLEECCHTIKLDTGPPDPLVDDVLRIHVSGLVPRAKITIHVTVKEGRYTFGSSGCYYADDNGNVDVGEIPSVMGTYTGLHQMGLFWSMIPAPGQPLGLRLLKTNASEPLVTKVTVHQGHVDFEDLFLSDNVPLAGGVINRWYMDKSVRKVIVRHGRLRGALFIPPGKGPFPGVIEMFGTIGSLVESRAALLASRGFVTFALAWFHYDGLPKHLEEVDLDYFMEAIEWLVSQSCVRDNGIGVIGVSKGGEIALQMAYYSPKVKAVVSINGLPFLTTTPLYYRGGFIGMSQLDQNAVKITPEGKVAEDAIRCDSKYFVPLYQTDTSVLLISGSDDRCLNYKLLGAFYYTYPLERRHLCELMIYEGAGHLIEPPHTPLTRVARAHLSGVSKHKGSEMVLWGGRTLQHANAQEHSWSKILNFFRANLSRPSYSSHL